jgi:outer membrane protein TolC
MMTFFNSGDRKLRVYKPIRLMLVVLSMLTFVLIPFKGVMAQDTPEDLTIQEAPEGETLRGASGEELVITDNTIKLPLKSVIVLALKNNLQIAFQSLEPSLIETNIMREESVYDFNFSTQVGKSRRVTQTANLLSGAGEDSVWQQSWDMSMDITKQFVTGTSAELKWVSSSSRTDFLFQGLVPEYQSELNLSLVQPLLKDMGIDIGKSMIKVANLNYEISQQEFKKRVMDILYQIETLYWNIFFQMKDLEAREKALEAAQALERDFRLRIDAGTLAPIEIYQAEATVAERKQDLIVARDLLKDTQDDLKSALNFFQKSTYWDVELIPADEPRTELVKEDLMESIKEAFAYRPDYNQAKMDIESRDIMVKYTKNQTLPRVDIFGTVGTMGLGGRGNEDIFDFTGGGNSTAVSEFSTGWSDVWDNMGTTDFYNYTIGLKIEFPIGNRFAKSQYSKAKIDAARAATYLKDIENIVITEVKEAVRQVNTDYEKIGAAQKSLRSSQEKLDAEEIKFDVGLSTTRNVLDFQDDLARAASRYALSLSQYEKSLANLARTKGVMLDNYNITIE